MRKNRMLIRVMGIFGMLLMPSIGGAQLSLVDLFIFVKNSEITLPVGFDLQLTVHGLLEDGSHLPLSDADWSVGAPADTGLAHIDSAKGILTGLSAGTITIFASHSGVTGSASGQILDSTLELVFVTPARTSLPLGLSRAFQATGQFDGPSFLMRLTDAVWSIGSSDDTGEATGHVTEDGEFYVTGTAEGTVTIHASHSGITGSAETAITVLVGLSIEPVETVAPEGSTTQLNAIGHFSDGGTQNISNLVEWTTTDPHTTFSYSGLASVGLTGENPSIIEVTATAIDFATGQYTGPTAQATITTLSFETGVWYQADASGDVAWAAFTGDGSDMVFLISDHPSGCNGGVLAAYGSVYEVQVAPPGATIDGIVEIRCKENGTPIDFVVSLYFDEAERTLAGSSGRNFFRVRDADAASFTRLIKQWKTNSKEEWEQLRLLLNPPPALDR